MSDKQSGEGRKRPGPIRHLPHEEILNRWAAGEKGTAIAAALGTVASNVRRVVHYARRRNDPRAVRRRAPNGQAGSGKKAGPGWVPFWADPRQIPLPLAGDEGQAP